MTLHSPFIEPSEPVEAALAEYFRRLDAGESVTPQDFLKQHPHLAAELSACLGVVQQIERMAGPQERQRTASASQDTSLTRANDTVAGPAAAAPAAKRKRASQTEEQLPRTFGRFEIQKPLGQGAMGAVYLAFDSRLQRKVALKFPKLALDEHADLRERFYREARSAATLRHPNICPVYDADCIDGVHFIAMACIEGRPLSDFINRAAPPDPRNTALVIRKIALAVHEAHKQGIIHRDLKPSNIIVDDRNEPIVMDFGLARLHGQAQPESPRGSSIFEQGSTSETQQGAIVGTPKYMSPEQANGAIDELGPGSDVFSVGVIFYEMLTGEVPFQGRSLAELLLQVMKAEPVRPTLVRPGIDPQLETICLKMLSKSPADRYGSMLEVSEALKQVLRTTESTVPILGEPAGASVQLPSSRGVQVALLVALVGLGAVAVALVASAFSPRTGTLVVEVEPADAEVRVLSKDGVVEAAKQAGGSGSGWPLAPGEHRVLVQREGYRTMESSVVLVAGQTETLRLKMTAVAKRLDLQDRDTAKWLLQTKARVAVRQADGTQHVIDNVDNLPRLPLRLTVVVWDSQNTLPRFDADDVDRLSHCVELQRVELRDQVITDLKWLAAFPKLRFVQIQDGSTTDAVFNDLGALTHLTALHLISGPRGVTPQGLRVLRNLTNLQQFSYNAFPGTDEGVVPLKDMRQLEHLCLWWAEITDDSIARVADYPRLQYVQLGANHRVTGAKLDAMRNLPMLKSLSFQSCQLDDAALGRLPVFETLESLGLGDNRITDAGLPKLRRSSRLMELALGGNAVTSKGVAALLPEFRELTQLQLDRTQVDDTAVPHLLQFTKLKILFLRETRLSEMAVEQLRKGLPGCQVEFSPPKAPAK